MDKTNDFNLKVITLNVRGLGEKRKRQTIIQYINDKKIDVAFLQETFITKKNEHNLKKDWDGYIFHCLSNSSFSRGVSILIRRELKVKVNNIYKSDDARKLMINADINDSAFSLICAYSPNQVSSRIDFFKRLSKWIKQRCCDDDKIIIGADLNAVDNEMDRTFTR